MNTQKLSELIENPRFCRERKALKLVVILGVLYLEAPESFRKLDPLTWPEGQAILLGSDRAMILRTNPTAQIKEIPRTPYFVDTGHDALAMRRLIELVMGKLDCDAGLTNRVKNLFQTSTRFEYC